MLTNKGLELIYQERALLRAKVGGDKALKKYFRNLASNFIKKPAVREFIFKGIQKCPNCQSERGLKIYYIQPVYFATIENFRERIHVNNLHVICSFCSQENGTKKG